MSKLKQDRVAIIGAGMAGLACAEKLTAHGVDVHLFDKGRGPGGRMSTRRVVIGDVKVGFDHGAQYFTARDPEFTAAVTAWEKDGLVGQWMAAGEDAWVGTPAMNAPIARLASDLQVRFSQRIDQLIHDGDAWRLVGEDAPADTYAQVVVAVPADQVPALVGDHNAGFAQAAASTPSAPCWTVMVAFESRVAIETDIIRTTSDLFWAARNSSKPGRTPVETWVLQASPDWSRSNRTMAPSDVIKAMLGALEPRARQPLPDTLLAHAHSWLYARSGSHGQGHLWEPVLGLGVCGDWLIGPRVENAWLSGNKLAASMIEGAIRVPT